MFFKCLLSLIFLFSTVHAEPLADDVQEIQLFFGEITELECCLLLNEKAKAPFKGFLLSPYQLVFLKDAIDTWDSEMQLQLKHINQVCDTKISLCQQNRDELLDQIKLELSDCVSLSDDLTIKNKDLSTDKTLLKASLYVSIPLSIVLGIYVGTKF